MMGMKGAMTRAAMTGLYHLGAHRLLAPYTQGAGVIFTLNQVRPLADKGFAPNRGLEVAPEFLDAMLDQVEEEGLDVVTLDEAARRLREDDERRFVCFTFDQAYRDFARHAYPLFQHRKLPLTLYVATDYASGWGELWWLALEDVISRANEIELCRQGGLWRLSTVTIEEKQRAFEQIHEWLRSIDEARQRQVIRALADSYDIDMSAACHAEIMGWEEIRALAADPIVTIGAHSKAHYEISKLSPEKALSEMEGSADIIEGKLGKIPNLEVRWVTAAKPGDSSGQGTQLFAELGKTATVEEVHAAMRMAAGNGLRGILQYTDSPVVSSDIIGNPHSSIFDAGFTAVRGGKYLRCLSWYDNEWGYSNRVCDLLEKLRAYA